MDKITVLMHIYNEEYLLPFWLNHHKNIFDHGVIVNYDSDDSSISIINNICPTWTVITSKNKEFDCINCDLEMMEVEENIIGYKLILNVTEFLFCEPNFKNILPKINNKCFKIPGLCLLSKKYNDNYYNPETFKQLLNGIDHINIYHRSARFIHSYKTGQYTCGRHSVLHNIDTIDENNLYAYIGCFTYYPWNKNLINRKLNVKNKLSKHSIDNKLGFHHLWTLEEMIQTKNELIENSDPITNFPLLVKLFANEL
jgi:hypothetical protein